MRYKVGNKVRIKSLDWYNENKDAYGDVECGEFDFVFKMTKFCGKILTIKSVFNDEIYLMKEDNNTFYWTDEMIEGLVEEEEIEFTEEDKHWCDIMSESDPTTYVLPQGYQFVDENGNVINATKIVLEKKKKEYPKTYKECCEVMNYCCNPVATKTIHKEELIRKFQFLILYRDAYWKLYGAEMGLGKPWEPDWSDNREIKYCIGVSENKIQNFCSGVGQYIFAFPTEEMRDAFYENFKSEIESCKELL